MVTVFETQPGQAVDGLHSEQNSPAPGSSTGVLSVAFAGLDVGAREPALLAVGETVKTLTINIPANKSVERWWPNGYGSQRLYPLEVTFAPGLAPGEERRGVPAVKTSKTVNVGFRTVAIEQPALADGQGKLNSSSLSAAVSPMSIPACVY